MTAIDNGCHEDGHPCRAGACGRFSFLSRIAEWRTSTTQMAVKNRSFSSRLFPCDACRDANMSLPALFATARPAAHGGLWVRVATHYIDAMLLNVRVH